MEYRPEIDGLRAVAVLPVILFHAGFNTFSGGFIGVDIFFVISGYLITSIILKDFEAGTFSFWEFYERRARRILPILFFVIICCIPFAWVWMTPMELKAFSASVVAVTVFMSNILFWRQSGYFDTAAELKPLLHTWSLAVEEQFYIFFPIGMLIFWRFGRKNLVASIALVAAISLALSEYGSRHHPSFNFYWLPTRAWELAAGSLCAFIAIKPHFMRDNLSSMAGLAAILFAVFYYDQATPFPSLYALLPVLGACMIILFAQQGTLVSSLLSLKPFVGLGLISYSAYLWHQPLFAFARIRSLTEPSHWLMATFAVASIVLAYFSWKYIEIPARKSGVWPYLERKTVLVLSTTLASLLIASGLAGHFTKGFPERVPRRAIEMMSWTSSGNPRSECISEPNRVIPSNRLCTYGYRDRASFIIIGDSHAHSLALELGNSVSRYGNGLIEFTYSGCPPLYSWRSYSQEAVRDCGDFRANARKFIQSNSMIDTVIISSRWSSIFEMSPFDNKEGGKETLRPSAVLLDDFFFSRGVSYESVDDRVAEKIEELVIQSITEFLASGKKVVLVYPYPEVGWNVPDFLSRAIITGASVPRPLSTSYLRFRDRSRRAYAALDKVGYHDNLIRVLPESIFCNTLVKDRCVAEDGSVPFYYDDDHVNGVGASMISKEIVKAMEQKGWIVQQGDVTEASP